MWTIVAGTIAAVVIAYWYTKWYSNDKKTKSEIPSFLHEEKFIPLKTLLIKHLKHISNDSLSKIIRQLNFWYHDKDTTETQLLALTQRLIRQATWQTQLLRLDKYDYETNNNNDNDQTTLPPLHLQVPKVRFGRTEIQMPIITCGSARSPHRSMPDNIPIVGSDPKKAIKTFSQQNIKDTIKQALKLGINHFETARFYGTSEYQLMTALSQLIEQGEIKRSDFILQTKVFPLSKAYFVKLLNESWNHLKCFGYIDLLSLHCVTKPEAIQLALQDGPNSIMSILQEWKQQGKIKHIGFSTHSSAAGVMELISSNKFDYVNLHYHFFGSYHAEGTMPHKDQTQKFDNKQTNHHAHYRMVSGNLPCVKKALELDMGVFCISPIDKGGRLYQPSVQVAKAVGIEMSPIAFALNHLWQTVGIHTASIGFGRPNDLEEVVEAIQIYHESLKKGKDSSQSKTDISLIENKLDEMAIDALGKEWVEKGLLNIPDFFTESTNGVGIGHALWCHNLVQAYGMVDMARMRYRDIDNTAAKWKKNQSFERNTKRASLAGYPGRAYDPSVDYSEALQHHYNPDLVLEKLKQVHEWLNNKDGSLTLSMEKRMEHGWIAAYDLRPWTEVANLDFFDTYIGRLFIQQITGGWIFPAGGPTDDSKDYGAKLRQAILE